MRAPTVALAGALTLALPSAIGLAETLTVAVSSPTIDITSNFTGARVTIFGVVEREAEKVTPTGDYNVAVVILGPPESVVVRRKDRILGIWANRAAETLNAAPAFYAISTSEAIDQLAPEAILDRLRIGFEHMSFAYRNRFQRDDPRVIEFREAFLRLKSDDGLYSEQTGVEFIGDAIFRTTIDLPANIPTGRYTVLVYLFSGESLVANTEETIQVSKIGFEELMFTFSRNQSLVYGLTCILLALFTGWLAGVIFRRD
jgi:uncharacterized protein (TIGR02186 family)